MTLRRGTRSGRWPAAIIKREHPSRSSRIRGRVPPSTPHGSPAVREGDLRDGQVIVIDSGPNGCLERPRNGSV